MSQREAFGSNGYGYAVARIKAMEHRLLDANSIQRLVDAEDSVSVLKILGETFYSRELASKPGEGNFDSVLESELLSVYRDVATFVPEADLVALCRLPYDFHNIKVLLKSAYNVKSGGKKRWDLLTSLGSVAVDDLILAVESEDYATLPPALGRVIPQCSSILEATRDPFEIEKLLDSSLFAYLAQMADKLGYRGVLEWSQTRIDGENLRNLVRLKRFGFDSRSCLSMLHEGGTISLIKLLALLDEPIETWSATLSYSQWGDVVAQIHEMHDFEAQIVALEKAIDEHSLSVLARYCYHSDAPENILAFLWRKEMEVKNLRTVIVSKSLSTDKEQLRRLIRNVAA